MRSRTAPRTCFAVLDSISIAMEVPTLGPGIASVVIYDRDLNAIDIFSPKFDGGLAFHPVKNTLFAIASSVDEIFEIDVLNRRVLSRIAIGEDVGPSIIFGGGMMTFSDDGKNLFLSTPSGIRLFQL